MTKADLHKLVDRLPEEAVDGAGVLLAGIVEGPIDADQAWFWTPEWQAGEREAQEQAQRGEGTVFQRTEEFATHLRNTPHDDA